MAERAAGTRRPPPATPSRPAGWSPWSVREAATRTDVVDVQHPPPAVLSSGRRSLTRLEQLQRDEVVRCLTRPGATVVQAAAELGLPRATLDRTIARYGIHVLGRGADPAGG